MITPAELLEYGFTLPEVDRLVHDPSFSRVCKKQSILWLRTRVYEIADQYGMTRNQVAMAIVKYPNFVNTNHASLRKVLHRLGRFLSIPVKKVDSLIFEHPFVSASSPKRLIAMADAMKHAIQIENIPVSNEKAIELFFTYLSESPYPVRSFPNRESWYHKRGLRIPPSPFHSRIRKSIRSFKK